MGGSFFMILFLQNNFNLRLQEKIKKYKKIFLQFFASFFLKLAKFQENLI